MLEPGIEGPTKTFSADEEERSARVCISTDGDVSLSLSSGKRRKDRGEDRKKGKKRIGIGVGEEREGERVARRRGRVREEGRRRWGNQGEWGTAHATRHHNGIMRQRR